MNKELQKLLKQINDKKNEVKSLVNDGKLDKAKAAKEELKELQNRFDLLYDLDEDEQGGIEDKVNKGTAKQVGGEKKVDKKNLVKAFVNIVKAGFLHREADEADVEVYKNALTSDTIDLNDKGAGLWDKDMTGLKVRDRFDVQAVDKDAVIKGEITEIVNG